MIDWNGSRVAFHYDGAVMEIMDCGSEEARKASKDKFLNCNTWEQFLVTWSKFYLNEVCIPTYYDVFMGAVDNPQANEALSKLFVDITLMECILTNSQVSITNQQKAYIDCYIPKNISRLLYIELNRYDGISAILNECIDDEDTDDCINLPYVTYNNWNKEKGEILKGVPFTRLSTGSSDLDVIRSWLNHKMKKIISPKYLDQIIILDANSTSEELNLVKILKECLRNIHTQNSIYLSIKNNDYNELTELLNTVDSVDVQSSIYGRKGVSMIETAVKNKNIKMINILLKYIGKLDTMLYDDILEDLVTKLGDRDIADKVESKLPEWYWR